jgi:hypothetical protein
MSLDNKFKVVWQVERSHLKIRAVNFSHFYVLSGSVKRVQKNCFYIAAFEHSLNLAKAPKLDFFVKF